MFAWPPVDVRCDGCCVASSLRPARRVRVPGSGGLPVRDPPPVEPGAPEPDRPPAHTTCRPPTALRSALLCELPLPGAELASTASRSREGRMASRRAVPARRLHRDEPPPSRQEGGRLLQRVREGGAMDQGGQERRQVDPALVHDLPGQRGPPAAPRAGIQPGQPPPHDGVADGDRGLVPDESAGEGGEDRGEGRRPRALPGVPDGRGGGATRAVPAPPRPDRRPPASRRGAMLPQPGPPPPTSKGRGASAGRPATANGGQEPPWRTASAAFGHESTSQEPEIACQITPRRARSV